MVRKAWERLLRQRSFVNRILPLQINSANTRLSQHQRCLILLIRNPPHCLLLFHAYLSITYYYYKLLLPERLAAFDNVTTRTLLVVWKCNNKQRGRVFCVSDSQTG